MMRPFQLTVQLSASILIFQAFLLCSSGEETSWWNSTEALGSLCETDNDNVGQHLGCSCKRIGNVDIMLEADCSNQWIEYNDTRMLPPGLNISRHLRILDFSKNHFSQVDNQTFGNCEAVEIILLGNNEIHTFEGVNCPRLLKLDLSRNKLRNLTSLSLSGLSRLVELDLSSNELIFLEPTTFEQLKMLRVLNLGSNLLGKELYLSDEYILSLSNLEKLEVLDISNSSLPDFPAYLINGTRHLKSLNLRNNIITFIESGVFEQLGELIELDLSGNLFKTIIPFQFMGMRKLQTLTLDKMRELEKIEEHAFAGLVNLNELSCQMNYYLTFIDPTAFHGGSPNESEDCHPRIVRMGDNDLRFIEYSLLPWKDIDILELHRNSWVCDCNLQWVSDFFRHKPTDAAIFGDSYFSCFEPHIFAGVPVVAVNPEEMLCFSPSATVAGIFGIVIFGILLFSFCTVIILNQMGMLPEWVRQYNIFGSGSSLPTYTRVNPRPNTKARRMVERIQAIPELHCAKNTQSRGTNGLAPSTEPQTDDLEWDNADIGRTPAYGLCSF